MQRASCRLIANVGRRTGQVGNVHVSRTSILEATAGSPPQPAHWVPVPTHLGWLIRGPDLLAVETTVTMRLRRVCGHGGDNVGTSIVRDSRNDTHGCGGRSAQAERHVRCAHVTSDMARPP